MTRIEWLNEVALGHAINGLRRQEGFDIRARERGSMMVVAFSPDYRNGGPNYPGGLGSIPKSAFRYEVTPRVWLHDEVDWRKGKHESGRILEGGLL